MSRTLSDASESMQATKSLIKGASMKDLIIMTDRDFRILKRKLDNAASTDQKEEILNHAFEKFTSQDKKTQDRLTRLEERAFACR